MLIMGNCISCKESLTNTEIIAFDNMPAAAQHMPDKEQVVGAGSVVMHDVEPNTLVAGNPAKFIRKIKP